ncbi:hypothetical protein IV203_026448 [Nitzschia inconspicua]|uniref:DUF6824 domain-containing protein n=1 Tax=Nitzschia inconspicua TaxID=303405 RepID=A0A9K3PXJ1_9STRA|nr:hypothetical protein IV203_026446 [Nitzschia inconspicua]KAG7363088.1 hypothetical protein IV203_026448 [Nitzschia inconspicua]
MESEDKKKKRSDSSGSSSLRSSDESFMEVNRAAASSLGYTLTNQAQILPDEFEPSFIDVVCGRGRASTRHNEEYYTRLLRAKTAQYYQSSQLERSNIIKDILATCRNHGVLFVRKNKKTDKWEEIGDKAARFKIAHAIRDRLQIQGTPIKGGQSYQQSSEDSKGYDTCNRMQLPFQGKNNKKKAKHPEKTDNFAHKKGLPSQHSNAALPNLFGIGTKTTTDSINGNISASIHIKDASKSNEMLFGQCSNTGNDSPSQSSILLGHGIFNATFEGSICDAGITIDPLVIGPHLGNTPATLGMIDPMAPVRSASDVAFHSEWISSQHHNIMQRYPQHVNEMSTNSIHTHDSNILASLHMSEGKGAGPNPSSMSLNITNNLLLQLENQYNFQQPQQQTQQHTQYLVMPSIPMTVTNLLSPYNPMFPGPCVDGPSSLVFIMPSDNQPAEHLTPAQTSASEELILHDENVNFDGFDLALSQAFEQDFDPIQGEGINDDEREGVVDDDHHDDIFRNPFLLSEDELEPL